MYNQVHVTVYSLDNINEIFEKYGVWKLIRKQFKYQIMNCERKLPYKIMFEALNNCEYGIPEKELKYLEEEYKNYLYEYEIYLEYKDIRNK